MAASKLVLFPVLIILLFTQIRTHASVGEEEIQFTPSDSPPTLKIDLEKLKSKIYALESLLDERKKELKAREDTISQKEKIIQEKFNTIASLQSELSILQKTGTKAAQELVGKAHARTDELENQVEKLKNELVMRNAEKLKLEARVSNADEKMNGLHLELKNLQKINSDQKIKIRKTEHALQIAEEELMKAKALALSKSKELMEVHGAWLPSWLSLHFLHVQSFMKMEWNEHGKPVFDMVIQKVFEKKAQAELWAEPHMETLKKKWFPVIREQWLMMVAGVEPYVQSSMTRAIEIYEASRTTIARHINSAHKITDPYFQDVRKVSKPYIDGAAILTKPHVDKIRGVLKPHTKKVIRAYRKFLKSATTYHHQVQDNVEEVLKKNELTTTFATKELVWFVASALLALPAILLLSVASSMFGKKPKKHSRTTNSSHPRRRKRVHADK